MAVKHFAGLGLILLASPFFSLSSSAIAQSTSAADIARAAIAARFVTIQNLSVDYQMTHADPWAGPSTRPAATLRTASAVPAGVTATSPRLQFVWPSSDDTNPLPPLPAAAPSLSFYPDHSIASRKTPDQGTGFVGGNVTTAKGTLIVGPVASIPNKESTCSFSFLQGNALWGSELTKETLGNYVAQSRNLVASETAAYKAGRLEVLSVSASGRSTGSLSGPDRMIAQSWIDVGLGLRADRQSIHWLAPVEMYRMDLTFDDQHRPVLTRTDELGIVYQYTFLPDTDYALCKYTVAHPTRGGGKPEIVEEINAGDFRQVQGVWLPFEMTLTQHVLGLPSEVTSRETIKVNSYSLNNPGNTIDQYQINWPLDIVIFDHRSDHSVRTEVGNHNLTDWEFNEMAQRQLNRLH